MLLIFLEDILYQCLPVGNDIRRIVADTELNIKDLCIESNLCAPLSSLIVLFLPITQFLLFVIIGSAYSKFLLHFEIIQVLPINRNKSYVAPCLKNELLCELDSKRMMLDGIILLAINYEREVIPIKGDYAQFFCFFEDCSS